MPSYPPDEHRLSAPADILNLRLRALEYAMQMLPGGPIEKVRYRAVEILRFLETGQFDTLPPSWPSRDAQPVVIPTVFGGVSDNN